MAEEATQMLMRLRDKEPVATRLELATSLVVRKSTGAPAGAERHSQRPTRRPQLKKLSRTLRSTLSTFVSTKLR